MLTIIHGDHLEASRIELNQLKQSGKVKEIRQLNGKVLDATTLTQALESSSLFGGEILIIVENLISAAGKKEKRLAQLLKLLKNSAQSAEIILWEDKEVNQSTIKQLGTAETKLFKLPVLIFQFLDALAPGSASKLLKIYQDLITNEPPELIFTMLVRRVQQLIMLVDKVKPEGLADWQVSRLTRQAKLFTMEKLILVQSRLLMIEYSFKTGASPFSLTQLTEQFLIDL